ncbi:TldD/PmbA family protein, partial [candidate division KSB1 bacterium]
MVDRTDRSALFYKDEDYYRELAESTVKHALEAGVSQAEVYLEWGIASENAVRLREPETVKLSSFKGMGIRVFKGGKQGYVSTTDFSRETLGRLVQQAAALADVSGDDQFAGLPESGKIEKKELNIFDDIALTMSTERKIELAKIAEEAAFAVDNRIANSDGGVFQDVCRGTIICNSNGLSETYYKSHYSIHVSPVVEYNGEKRYGYWFSSGTHYSLLDDPKDIGRIAGERAIRLLGAKKTRTQKIPVIFDQPVASGFFGTIMNGVTGDARNKKETCFWDKMGKEVAASLVTVYDDGLLDRGVGSSLFDGEGVQSRKKTIIENGQLNSFL